MRVKIALGCLALISLTMLVGLHRSYSPGPLLIGHRSFASNCAACHQPWSRVDVSSHGCVDCHGDMSFHNKHAGTKLADEGSGLMPGFHLAELHGEFACLSCHTEHVGQVGLARAARDCSWCHQHPTIDGTSKHTKDHLARKKSTLTTQIQFSHKEELDQLRKQDPSAKLVCFNCHRLEKVDRDERFLLIRTASRPATGEPDTYVQMWAAQPSTVNQLPMFTSTLHINAALFKHSSAHLANDCEVCHLDIENSTRSQDGSARNVAQCFPCHAKAPAPATITRNDSVRGSLLIGPATANAEVIAPSPKMGRYKTCAECHLLHTYQAGPIRDFPTTAPSARPHPTPERLWLPALLATLGGGFTILLFVAWMTKPTHQHLQARVGTRVPSHKETFETNVPKLYIIGEAAGIPAINDAMRSGQKAALAILSALKPPPGADPTTAAKSPSADGTVSAPVIASPAAPEQPAHGNTVFDVIIAGCGPAGMGAATCVKANGLKYLVLEKLSVASTIRAYPRGKLVHATPLEIDDYDQQLFLQGDDAKEQLIDHWNRIIEVTKLEVNEHEEVQSIRRAGDFLEVKTGKDTYLGRTVALAIGVRGSPRKLGMRNETPGRVFYDLEDPSQFHEKKILVVGGGNAGHEVVIALTDPKLKNTVTFSYIAPRGVTVENRQKISTLVRQGRLSEMALTTLVEIRANSVVLASVDPPPEEMSLSGWMIAEGDKLWKAFRRRFVTHETGQQQTDYQHPPASLELPNDVIFAMIGAEPPTGFFQQVGIEMEIKGR